MGQEISQPNQRQNCTKLPHHNNNHNNNKNTKLDCKQNFQKQKIRKALSTHSSASTDSSSGYQTTSTTSAKIKPILVYDQVSPESSTITNRTGIYYPSYYCSSSGRSSVSVSIASSVPSSRDSHKSVHKQKDYLDHHLYIKSYLDIVEEDEKAKEHFQTAKPGIRNYTPKILAEKTANRTNNNKDEAWI
ncbi:bromodomain-containing protein DDB_G0270170 [Episyrphus balteatus]|uniref:bromodomain-containing protein DDB_G0270170 n=1 Tax=Episyrphus balteatus TaxID=286459 RepID=UPI0024859996|nr:bromodomain-containing protein DDB_G0270170 [Episyrphus balteatus]